MGRRIPILGYDVDPAGGRLIVNNEEAAIVREIFTLFEQYGSARWALAEIERRGWKLKSWTTRRGAFRTGTRFSISSLRRLLSNVLYTGMVRSKDQLYPGEHAAIIEYETWSRVQNLMGERHSFARGKMRNKHLALLNGLLYCEACSARMVYTYASKNNRRYPYYVCTNACKNGWGQCPAKSLPAKDIEDSVLERVRAAQAPLLEGIGWEQLDKLARVRTIQSTVDRVRYDARRQQISISFHEPVESASTPAGITE